LQEAVIVTKVFIIALKRVSVSALYRLDRNGELVFFAKSILGKVAVPKGSMSGDELSKKLIQFSKGKKVLEFGSGGSTFIFAEHCKALTSIESDFFFAKKVRKSLKDFENVKVLWVNIGPTKSFGQPIEKFRRFFSKKWREYPKFLWAKQSKILDLVFIDGRFRVWVAINCFLNIESEFIIVFDDYFSRNEYHFVETFLGQPSERINDSAVFQIRKMSERIPISFEALEGLEDYGYDFR